MKRYISLVLAVLLVAFTLCGCEENPLRATCTLSGTNGFTGVYCAFECKSDQSSTYRATFSPINVAFDEPGSLSYKFECPACEHSTEGKLTPAESVFLRCDCEENPQALVVSARFSENYTPDQTPKYEREP